MDVYTKTNSTEIPKSKRSSVYVPLHLRNEDDSTLKKYANEEASKRNSLRRPKSNRYSRNSFIEDDNRSTVDYSDQYESDGPQEDWENILRQCDRYGGDDDKLNARKSKRASRLLESFNDVPVEIPVVEEPTVVLDCFDFPPAFKTHHLHDIFRNYESMRGGYKIKWLSDTRALIIFEHPATAKKAYIDNVTHPLAKIRPYEGPTDFLKENTNQAQRRPMSMDMKRQSMNNGYGNGRNSNRNSMRLDELDIKRLNLQD